MRMEWKTIRIPEEDFDEHNKRRKDLGVTWAEYIEGVAPSGGTQHAIQDLADRIDEMSLYLDEVRNRLEALH